MSESLKIVSTEEASKLLRAAQKRGEVVVMCHGCFDIVHPGHIRHLQQAAKFGDRLLVTITRDVDLAKGESRPLIPQELRAESLAALDCVSWVAVNPRPTAAELLEELKPDVYVKGREYEHNEDPRFHEEKDIVERNGGRVVFTSGDVIFSSSALIDALEERGTPFQATLHKLIEQAQITPRRIDQLIASFQGRRILVVGETIKDTYVMCDRPDMASEGPLMTLRPIEYRSFDGGAAIIARHLAAMGAKPTLLTALPCSRDAEALRQRLALENVAVRWIEVDRPIIEKRRFLVGTTKMMKLDLGESLTLDASDQQHLIDLACESAESCDGAIIADFGQGLFTSTMLTRLCKTLRTYVKIMAGDVSGRRSNLLALHGMDLLCPSEVEMRDAMHDYDEGLSSVVWHMMHQTGAKAAMVTLGDQGLITFDRRDHLDEESSDFTSRLKAEHIPALTSHAVDQLGCGDALLAAATLTLVSGGSLVLAGVMGNIAASIQARKLGNAVIGAADLRIGVRRLVNSQLMFETEPKAMLVSHSRDQLSAAYP